LIDEEYGEFKRAANRVDKQQGAIDPQELTEMIDAAFDLVVVAKGFLLSLGVSLDEVFAHGWRSNLNKIDPGTVSVRKRADGKVLKPDGWQPPNFAQFNPLLFTHDPATRRVTGPNE
jgi:predicted HAD superfamily Cof-like phosphohydrolase